MLLLSERVLLAQRLAQSFAPEDGRTIHNQTLREMVEVLLEWTPAERGTALPPRGVELGAAWEHLCANTQDRPQLVSAPGIAQVLGVSGATWGQWVFRGRVHLARQLGPAAARALFPTWPPGVFERAGGTAGEDEP